MGNIFTRDKHNRRLVYVMDLVFVNIEGFGAIIGFGKEKIAGLSRSYFWKFIGHTHSRNRNNQSTIQ